MFVGGCGSQVGLQGHVAKVLQPDDAKLVGMVQQCRHREWDVSDQERDLDEWHGVEVDRAGVKREHDRTAVIHQDAEIPTIRGVPRQREHLAGQRPQSAVRRDTG